ncbi:MAG: hypothetical protein RLZZ253_2261, partial [Verrucomicrobiota bacterium]
PERIGLLLQVGVELLKFIGEFADLFRIQRCLMHGQCFLKVTALGREVQPGPRLETGRS